ncbi:MULTISPECIES: recombinase family protein [unclassified Clostridium]|uniref:recombinase family protein n=1 Tax=unclassified Clostridium TaxID=2614128 RepID=UPI00029845DF|nr:MULTISPECIES: recombinase family protein [unclassified Clostridium]EKQ57255.1 MAG: site-specific recombinase, DNA invertase Pin [Clostridium sp. Maddingley MBC34-26]
MKAAIYARYSSDNQREESIDAQIRAIKEYADKNGIIITKIYTDEARSATTDNRPRFLEMIKDSEFGLFDAVIVHKLDRFSRDRYDSAHYKRILKKNNVRLISVLEHLDDSPESIILESVLQGMAEYYSKNLAREVMKGMKETALQCKHTGGKPPLGYDVDPATKKYIVNQYEASSIKLIFQMYSEGYGYSQIINKLNLLGYKTKTGKPFGKNSLSEILRNEKYIGIYVFNKVPKMVDGKRNSHRFKNSEEIIRIPDGLPAIVDEETFNKVAKRMIGNKRNATNKAKEPYILSGKIFCGSCGAAMIGHTSHSGRNKTKYSTYNCGTRYRTKQCKMKNIQKEYIEDLTLTEIKNKILNPSSIKKLTKKLIAHYSKMINDNADELKQLDKRLKELQFEIDNIVEAISKGMFHISFKEKMDTLETEKIKISGYINELQAAMNSSQLNEKLIEQYLMKDFKAINEKSANDLKTIINTYVESIQVYDDKVDINLILFFVHLNGGGEA